MEKLTPSELRAKEEEAKKEGAALEGCFSLAVVIGALACIIYGLFALLH